MKGPRNREEPPPTPDPEEPRGLDRRSLLRAAALAPFAAALSVGQGRGEEPGLEQRGFGATEDKVTLLGLGGVYVGRRGGDEKTARATVARALDLGVNYIDTASQYGAGLSEERIGKVLGERQARDQVFLATKTLERGYDDSLREIEASLGRLRVDRVDLLQIHAVNDDATLDAILSRDGSLRAARRALEEGRARYLGITGHTRPSVLRRALEAYPFTSVLVPLGPADVHVGDFLRELVPVAREKNAAVIAMKVLAAGRSVGRLPVADCLRYAFSLPVATAIVGMGSPEEVEENVAVARTFSPMKAEDQRSLEDRARELGTTGTLWWKRRS